MTETPTTELEAINSMLANIGTSPVNTLSGALRVDVSNARKILSKHSRQVQSEGWVWNTEHCYPLPRNEDDEIQLPQNLISVVVTRGSAPDLSVIQRGMRLYDRKNHTFSFTEDKQATIVFALPFDEIPEHARLYIFLRAARKFQETTIGSNTLSSFDRADEARARADMLRAEPTPNILDNMGTFKPAHVLNPWYRGR